MLSVLFSILFELFRQFPVNAYRLFTQILSTTSLEMYRGVCNIYHYIL